MINYKLKFLVVGIIYFCTGFNLEAQTFPAKNYPLGYFRDPLDIPIILAGNFGELRPGHFHMGLDIKTMARVNLAVHAAADGYIARVKIEPGGFGRAIYINHPNGYTTLYAHLNDFNPALEAYVKKQQYKQESWKIFIDLPQTMFPVKKGDFIAYSGTTGGSQGPHLHFEVRRTFDDVNLNPMLFGVPLLDNTKPVLLKLALYDRTKSTYEQSPSLITVKASAMGYATLPATVVSSSYKISFAISAYDTHSGGTNKLGIYEAWIYDNEKLVTGFQIEKISYDDTRYINANIDYKTRAAGGPYFQHLSILPGNQHSVYTKVKGDGVLDISDGAIHAIKIVVKDAYGNTSELRTGVQYKSIPAVKSPPVEGKVFYPSMIGINDTADCQFYIAEKCLYDSVHIKYVRTAAAASGSLSAMHTIGSKFIPLQDAFVIRIKPTQNIPADKLNRVIMHRSLGPEQDVEKVTWQNGWASAKFRDFGSFQLVLDEQPPVIVPVGFKDGSNLSKAARIAFTIHDNMQSYKNFRAELDGKWLRFTNDKGRVFIYNFDEMCPSGQHALKVSIDDEAGNSATATYHFTR